MGQGVVKFPTLRSGGLDGNVWNIVQQPLGTVVLVSSLVPSAARIPMDLSTAENTFVSGKDIEIHSMLQCYT